MDEPWHRTLTIFTKGIVGFFGCFKKFVDRRNHHVFQPLLYEVATAALSAPDIAHPIRRTFSNQPNVDVWLGDVTSIDPTGKRVILRNGFFTVWSSTVQIEGMGVCRHGDLMGQNSASGPPPSTLDEAKTAWRNLMRKYHPDKHQSDPKKAELANKVAARLTDAYRIVKEHLES